MTPQEMRDRTYRFALRTLRFVQQLPRTLEARTIGDQLLRSSTSVAANYRASCRGRTRKEFIAKIGVALEESDESVLLLQLLLDGEIRTDTEARNLRTEAEELTAILAASWRTARSRSESSDGRKTNSASSNRPGGAEFRAEDLLRTLDARPRE